MLQFILCVIAENITFSASEQIFIEFRPKPNTVNRFHYLWSEVKQVIKFNSTFRYVDLVDQNWQK